MTGPKHIFLSSPDECARTWWRGTKKIQFKDSSSVFGPADRLHIAFRWLRLIIGRKCKFKNSTLYCLTFKL